MTATLNDPSRIHPLVASAARMRDWLLGGPAQIRFGAEAGGVAGTLNAAGQPDYVYGEITGYYLHWLAGSHLSDDPLIRPSSSESNRNCCNTNRICPKGAR